MAILFKELTNSEYRLISASVLIGNMQNPNRDEIRIAISSTQPPADTTSFFWLYSGRDIPFNAETEFSVWARMDSYSSGYTVFSDEVGSPASLSKAMRYAGNIPVLGVASLSNADYMALSGDSYIINLDEEWIALQVRWFKFVTPAEYGLQIIKRAMIPNIAGCDYKTYTGTVATESGVTYPAYNKLTQAVGDFTLIGLNAPTTTGARKRTVLFSGTAGQTTPVSRPATAGGSEEGFDFIPPSSTAFVRIENLQNAANRIVLDLSVAKVFV